MDSQQLPSVARPGHVEASKLLQSVLSHKPLVGELPGWQFAGPDQALDRFRVDAESFGCEMHICVLVKRVRLQQHTAHRRSPPLTSLRESVWFVCRLKGISVLVLTTTTIIVAIEMVSRMGIPLTSRQLTWYDRRGWGRCGYAEGECQVAQEIDGCS